MRHGESQAGSPATDPLHHDTGECVMQRLTHTATDLTGWQAWTSWQRRTSGWLAAGLVVFVAGLPLIGSLALGAVDVVMLGCLGMALSYVVWRRPLTRVGRAWRALVVSIAILAAILAAGAAVLVPGAEMPVLATAVVLVAVCVGRPCLRRLRRQQTNLRGIKR